MKKRMGRGSILSLLALLTVFMVVACSSKSNNMQPEAASSSAAASSTAASSTEAPKEELKDVKLKMYLLGEAPPDLPLVLEEINKKLTQDIQATLEINYLSWADFETKYPLLFASGEKFDMIYTANWAFFNSEAPKGSFMALNDLLPQYAPETFKQIEEAGWKEASLDDKIYMIPAKATTVNKTGIAVRGDLIKKYNIGPINTVEDLGKYLATIKENEPEIMPFNIGQNDVSNMGGLAHWVGTDYLGWPSPYFPNSPIRFTFDDPTFFYFYETPEYIQHYDLVRDWQQKGYWSKSALSNQVRSLDAFKNGTSGAAFIPNLDTMNSFYADVVGVHPEWDPQWIGIGPEGGIQRGDFISNGMAINKNAENPERALMMLELFRTSQDYFDLTHYGIKGMHYDLDSNGKLTLPPGVTQDKNGFAPDSMSPWGWRVDELYRQSAVSWPLYTEVKEGYKKYFFDSNIIGLQVDTTNIKTEVAAIDQVMLRYKPQLDAGMVDPKEVLAVFKEQLQKAGLQKVNDELQKQVNDFWQENNNK